MATKGNPFIDTLYGKLESLPLDTPLSLARALPLYMKVLNDNGVVRSMSGSYIDNYDGKNMYRKFTKWFNAMHENFKSQSLNEDDIRQIFRKVADHRTFVPRNVKEMRSLAFAVRATTTEHVRARKLQEARKGLVARFRLAVKKYLNLTWELGFNEPSACALHLARTHAIDRYIMSGDFSVMLLPFLPEIEDAIRRSYENYEMVDAWDNLKGRYFNHREEFRTLAMEIKAGFNRKISNFSQYFDRIYTDTYYKMMLGKGLKPGGQ